MIEKHADFSIRPQGYKAGMTGLEPAATCSTDKRSTIELHPQEN